MALRELRRLRDKGAVVGIGTSDFGHTAGVDDTSRIAEALRNALDDAGLRKQDIDGMIVNLGPEVDRLPQLLGMEIDYAFGTWRHSRMSAGCIQLASMVVHAGLANYVVCISGNSSDSLRRVGGVQEGGGEAFRPGGGPHWEFPHFGMVHPGALAAMAFRRYVDFYGGRAENLGAVAVAQRKGASLNPIAVYKKPITMDDYVNARFVIEPLRLFDFSAIMNGMLCVIVTTPERAKNLRKPPIYISGMQGMRTGRKQVVFAMPGIGAGADDLYRYSPPKSQKVYDMAGVKREDVDIFYVHDSFSPEVIYGLEQFGFCPPGEALSWIQGGRIEIGGELPVNTNGGHLSEGTLGGWGQIVEAIRQLRAEAGQRQVQGAKVAQYAVGTYASVIFKNFRER
jgi:acetyl-CoA acetyltransferase